MARHVADVCTMRGLRVPDQIAILGVDNSDSLCEANKLTLSSVDPDLKQVGCEAAAMLDKVLGGSDREISPMVVKPRGVVSRRSTDPVAFEDSDLATALRLIRTGDSDEVSVVTICQAISISRRELERRFRETIGHAPGEEIRRVRMDRARGLLATTNLPVADICARCGYEHLASFSSAFRKSVGMTPRAYRAKCAK
jgi:LacI family transcriptional regulator